ncbi:hypothetical protein SKAU_G00115240 [Synaphobranchus kaupii]|uniref:C2H2-type domain-containing protein n=1 Tax=Synaphobranchus kaupii TaxID=118154 RepID=A0A9Q1FN70_SYNKA|nr:hypothetical protein SKAU_G00115240 [Synaphobranchus kaupii]
MFGNIRRQEFRCDKQTNERVEAIESSTNRGAALLHTFEQQYDAGRSLRRDTETTLPELTEQHSIRQKEEQLSGMESVHMAESETECAAPGLDTLEPECVTAHSGVSDVHHIHTSLIKIEADLDSTHTGDIKTESLESTELGHVTHLHPDKIKTETDDGGYLKAEHISDLQDIKCVDMKSDKMKCECSESFVSDVMNTVMNLDHKDQTEPWKCAGEPNPNPNCKNEEIHDMSNQCGELKHYCILNNEDNQTRIVKKSTNGSKNQSPLNFFQKQTVCRNKYEMNTGVKSYKCTDCEKCFKDKSGLNIHLRIHMGEKPHNCTQCGKSFSQESQLNSHQRIHTGEKPHKCIQCGKYFPTISSLNRHQRSHTGEKPYKCTRCGKCFSTISNLNYHQIIHTGEKPYNCTQCGKCFSLISYLNVHQTIHTGAKPYKCTQCEKCFHRKSILNSHLRIHIGERPYKCILCGKCFSRISHLNIHQSIHTGEKPYKCSDCGKAFSQISNLKTHQRIHTGEKPYKCTQCGKCFSRANILSRHKMIHTGEKPGN